MLKTKARANRPDHSDYYYRALLLALITSLERKLADEQIAKSLNATGLMTPQGRPWTRTGVKQALYRLRHAKTQSSVLHRVLVRFIREGMLSISQAFILFERRGYSGGPDFV